MEIKRHLADEMTPVEAKSDRRREAIRPYSVPSVYGRI